MRVACRGYSTRDKKEKSCKEQERNMEPWDDETTHTWLGAGDVELPQFIGGRTCV